ncbi:hypothetical protein A2U01_0065728, partial [Trifolium medium]|nr:hypothetical protein [Trifolium medium]
MFKFLMKMIEFDEIAVVFGVVILGHDWISCLFE